MKEKPMALLQGWVKMVQAVHEREKLGYRLKINYEVFQLNWMVT